MLGVGLALVVWAKASLGVAVVVAIATLVFVGYLDSRATNARRVDLTARFGVEIADAIIKKRFWQGATYEMMQEAHGTPVEVRQKVLKSKTRETHCYRQIGKNRFGLRCTTRTGWSSGGTFRQASLRPADACNPGPGPRRVLCRASDRSQFFMLSFACVSRDRQPRFEAGSYDGRSVHLGSWGREHLRSRSHARVSAD